MRLLAYAVTAVTLLIFAPLSALPARAQKTSATAAKSAPRTVLDFYLRLPRDPYFAVKTDRKRIALCKQKNAVLDIAHGYLRFLGNADTGQYDMTVCLFKRTEGSYLVAVAANPPEEGDYQAHLEFYEWKQKRLAPVARKSVLPLPFNDQLEYPLPRTGTTIHVTSPVNSLPVYDLIWTGRAFRVQKPAASVR